MNMLNATLMSAKQPPLEKRGNVVDAWHRHVSRIGAGTDRKWGKSPGGFGDGLHRSVGECQKMAEFRAYRSAGERMLHLRARTFALLTTDHGNLMFVPG